MAGPPRLFDRNLHRRRLDRAARRYAGFLKRRAAEDLVQRLEAVRRDFPLAVDLGARDGAFATALAKSDAAAKVGLLVQTDLSAAMLAGRRGPRVVADEERLPFAHESLDLVVSSLALHWTNDFVGALIQIREALKPDGLFLGAILGGATLMELRGSLMTAELELRGGAGPRVSPFADAFDAAQLLQRAGFALPVADQEEIRLLYAEPLHLLRDLRAAGEANAVRLRDRRPPPRLLFPAALGALPQEQARAITTLRIAILTGWAPGPGQPQPLRPGSATHSLAGALTGG